MKKLSLYFLRHGQTPQSKSNLFCGSGLNPELTSDGEAMAKCFAQAFERIKWEAVYASPLKRAVKTAQLAIGSKDHQITLDEDLKEIGFGEWEGKSIEQVNSEFHDDYIRWMADPAWCPPTKGETAVAIAERGMRVVDRIRHQVASGNVLIVSHKATIRIILCNLLGIDVGRFRFRLDCPVCSLSLVDITQQGPLLRTLADRSHLTAEMREMTGT